jgi:4-alpha-glucanotransferase
VTDAWGIETRYRDQQGEWRDVPQATVDAVRGLLGEEAAPPPSDPSVRVVTVGEAVSLHGEFHVEDGGSVRLDGLLPPDVPLGYHRLDTDERSVRVVVAPPRCHLPPDLRTWGWAVQLYALRSRESWGIGDYADLGRFGRWATRRGAGVVLVSPLHAPLPAGGQASPYFPSSRCFRNPVHLRVEGEAGRALNDAAVIDRDAVWGRKAAALEARFSTFAGNPAFDRFCRAGGDALLKYAAFCVLVEHHGSPWREWPEDVRHPDGPGVARVVQERGERVRFHQWLQWLVDEQVGQAAAEVALVHDLAVGCDPAGADAWLWQDAFCFGARIGAPPDGFNTAGQDWGLPPFHPRRLQEAGYEPFVHIVRAALRHAGGVRIDHVMGLFRLWWIPDGRGPSEGAYVRYPADDLLGILALESVRAGAFVVGEDLGTVEPSVREEMDRRDMLSYRLVWFGSGGPDRFPPKALAAVTTHDLPTIPGVWSGRDGPGIRPRLREWAGAEAGTPVGEVVERTYRRLAQAPSMVVVATLEDALGVEERPNVPGTGDADRPNWSLPLPLPLEEIEADQRMTAVSEALRRP